MNNMCILVIGELIVVAIIILVKILLKYKDDKKIDGIVNLIERKSQDKIVKDRIDECQEILCNEYKKDIEGKDDL